MRHSYLSSPLLLAALATALAAGAIFAQTDPPAQTPSAALGPYKAVPITLPAATNDPSFEIFRKRLAEIAQKKDRAALAEIVAADFFWIPEDTDIADKKLPAVDNAAKALGFNGGAEAIGWDALAAYAAEPSTMADPQRNGVFCAPAEAGFDEKAADELATARRPMHPTGYSRCATASKCARLQSRTQPSSRSSGSISCASFPTIPPRMRCLRPIKVLTPDGKVGFVPLEWVLPIGGEQLCYVKDACGWKIAGFLGGEPNQ